MEAFPSLDITPGYSKVERCCKPRNPSEFFTVCRIVLHATPQSSDFSQTRSALYREPIEEFASDSLCGWLGLAATKLRSFWSWLPVANYLSGPEFSLSW